MASGLRSIVLGPIPGVRPEPSDADHFKFSAFYLHKSTCQTRLIVERIDQVQPPDPMPEPIGFAANGRSGPRDRTVARFSNARPDSGRVVIAFLKYIYKS